MKPPPRVTYNPFCRIDPAKDYAGWWHRRAFSRAMAVGVGFWALVFYVMKLFR